MTVNGTISQPPLLKISDVKKPKMLLLDNDTANDATSSAAPLHYGIDYGVLRTHQNEHVRSNNMYYNRFGAQTSWCNMYCNLFGAQTSCYNLFATSKTTSNTYYKVSGTRVPLETEARPDVFATRETNDKTHFIS